MNLFNELKTLNPATADMYLEYYQKLSREEFLEKACGDMIDYYHMYKRVELFMSLCTDMSYTTYPLDTIKQLVNKHQDRQISEFCKDILLDYEDSDELIEYIKKIANEKY